jgi:hypothetical protein
MDELVQHCLRELAFDGDLGKLLFALLLASSSLRLSQGVWRRVRIPVTPRCTFLRIKTDHTHLTGSSISRLKDFISEFYERESNKTSTPKQVVDDSFSALVWSIIVQQPDVYIGTVPSWNTSEVYIAPQQSAKRKAKKDGDVEQEQAPPMLELLQNAHRVPLRELLAQYGDTLRVAVSPQTIFRSITGSPFRVNPVFTFISSTVETFVRI